MANQWDRWLRGGKQWAPPRQADPRLPAGESHPLPANKPHYTMAMAIGRFVRNVGAPEEAPAPRASRGTRQRSQSAHHGPACKARPGPPPYTSAAWPATAVAGRPAAWQPPPAAAAARPGRRDRVHTRSPAPRPRPAAAPGRADRNARGSADRRHVSWGDMSSDKSASYSYESGSDSGPGEPTHGQRSWAQPAAAAADGWGHRGARAQRVDHDRPPQYESSSPRTRALVFANWSPMGAAAPYLEVPPLIRRDAPEELRGQYIYAQFPIQDSCLFGARPWQILNQHFQKHTSMILAGETLKQILWMKFLRVKLHGGTRAMLVVQWGFLHELRSMETFGTYILLTSYIYVEKNPPPLNK